MTAMIWPALLLAGAALPAADRTALDTQVAAIFRPYSQEPAPTPAWDYPVWSASVRALIVHWRRVTPEGEVDDLSDGDWLCQCQDWDHRHFRVIPGKPRRLTADRVEIPVRLDIGWKARRDARLVLVRETAGWRLDDLFSKDMPRGLQRALRDTIAKDEAL